jgi:hypothetical protein
MRPDSCSTRSEFYTRCINKYRSIRVAKIYSEIPIKKQNQTSSIAIDCSQPLIHACIHVFRRGIQFHTRRGSLHVEALTSPMCTIETIFSASFGRLLRFGKQQTAVFFCLVKPAMPILLFIWVTNIYRWVNFNNSDGAQSVSTEYTHLGMGITDPVS